jgi:hypothetical protein
MVRRGPAIHPDHREVRRLLLGGEVRTGAAIVVAWCVAVTLVGYAWAQRLDDRDPAR